jgi:hypothetical protein
VLGLSEEAVKLPAGVVERTLPIFPSSQPLWIVDHITDKLFRRNVSQRRVFIQIADNLAAKQSHIVDMVLDGLFRQAGRGEVHQEG